MRNIDSCDATKLQPSFTGAPSTIDHSQIAISSGQAVSSKNNVSEEISRRIHQDVSICYQCGKCSAGCPVRKYMDVSPNRIVRLIQLGMNEAAFESVTPWLCAGCLACSTRCPNNFDLAKFMDAIREIAVERNIDVKEKDVLKFHNAFLKQIRRFGRSFEAGLVLDFKLKSFKLFQDVDSSPGMIKNRKLKLIPHKIGDRKSLKEIFRKTNTGKE